MAPGAMVRDAESRAVTEFLTRVRSGPAGVIFEGEAGIGKTTAWVEAVRRAGEAGYRVLSARTSEAEARLTFTTLADLLDGVEPAPIERLPPVQRAALDRVLLRDRDGPATTDERVVAAAFHAVLESVAEQTPVVVAIDDLQWLDAASQLAVGYAVRRLRGPVGILTTARTGDPNCPEPDWLQLPDPGASIRLRLAPLSLGAMHNVLAAQLGHTLPRSAIARIHQISGGNPFFAVELARGLDEPGTDHAPALPDSLAAVVARRLGTVSDTTNRLLLAAACVAGPEVADLARLARASVEQVIELLEEAEDRGIVTFSDNRVQFTHPLLSHGVYSRATSRQRRDMHRSLAAITEHPELRARHLALAAVNPDPATLDALDAAAADAAARGAPSAAAELLDLAIALDGTDPVRLLRAAELHFRAGALTEANRLLDTVLATVPPGILRAAGLLLKGAVYGYRDGLARAVGVLSEGVREAGDNPALRLQGLLLLSLAVGLAGDLEGSVNHARQAVADAEMLGIPSLRSQALTLLVQVSFIHGLGTQHDALQTALELEQPDGAAAATLQASAAQAVNYAWTGRLPEARERMAAIARRCMERGSDFDAVWTSEFLTMIALWQGHYGEAARVADEATERAALIEGQLPDLIALICRTAVAAHTGRVDDTRRMAKAAIDLAHGSGVHFAAISPTTSLAFLEVSLRNYDAALAVVGPLLATFDADHGTEIMVGGWLPEAIEALVRTGRTDEAEPLIAALLTNGVRLDRPWMRAAGARGRATLLAALGDLESAEHAVGRALADHDRVPMPFEKARTQLLLGQIQRRRRRRGTATATLHEALSIFETLGSPLWAERTRAELARLQGGSSVAAALTPAERRVAELAAAGRSNREIAAELFVSPKTVEVNLSRVYRKFGIRSRAQLFATINGPDADKSRENPDSGAAVRR